MVLERLPTFAFDYYADCIAFSPLGATDSPPPFPAPRVKSVGLPAAETSEYTQDSNYPGATFRGVFFQN